MGYAYPEFSTALFAYSTCAECQIRTEAFPDAFRDLTWNIRPSGEYVLADKSYPVPMEVIVISEWLQV